MADTSTFLTPPDTVGLSLAAQPVFKLYMAGPMTGLPGFNYDAFHSAARVLRDAGYAVVSPAEAASDGVVRPWVQWMRILIPQLLVCDGVALLDGWETSRGATLEEHVASALGMPVLEVDDWLDR